MTAQDSAKKLLADAESAFAVGNLDVAKTRAALATAHYQRAAVEELFPAMQAAQRQHPFNDPRELRAWCLDRAISMRGFLLDGKEADQLLAMAEKIRAYVESGALASTDDAA